MLADSLPLTACMMNHRHGVNCKYYLPHRWWAITCLWVPVDMWTLMWSQPTSLLAGDWGGGGQRAKLFLQHRTDMEETFCLLFFPWSAPFSSGSLSTFHFFLMGCMQFYLIAGCFARHVHQSKVAWSAVNNEPRLSRKEKTKNDVRLSGFSLSSLICTESVRPFATGCCSAAKLRPFSNFTPIFAPLLTQCREWTGAAVQRQEGREDSFA